MFKPIANKSLNVHYTKTGIQHPRFIKDFTTESISHYVLAVTNVE